MRVVMQAVRSRQPMVDYVREHIPQLEVVYDSGEGVWPTFWRSLDRGGDEAHIHLEDDVTLCRDFLTRAEEAIGDGRTLVQFFSRMPLGPPLRRAGSSFSFTTAFFLPARYGTLLARYLPHWNRGPWPRRGQIDYMIADWMKMQRIGYWQVNPSIVQHTPLRSLLGHPGVRMSDTFTDPELSHHPYPHLLEQPVS